MVVCPSVLSELLSPKHSIGVISSLTFVSTTLSYMRHEETGEDILSYLDRVPGPVTQV